jgi:drug/metabolite transporter (DMT)-like permease
LNGSTVVLGLFLAVMTAVSNAASNVLQRIANRGEGEENSMSPKLLWRLLHRKVWLAGFIAIVASFLLQAGALSASQLALVQPVIILELPLTLIAASVVLHAPMRRREWMAVIMLSAGLAILIVFLSPHRGRQSTASGLAWVIGVGACVAFIGGMLALSRRRQGARRAALIGAGTGVGFGLTAAFTKAAMAALSTGGIEGLLSSWATYAMAVSGLGAMFLMQNALQAGPLVAAQPGITLLDPFAAILWGVGAFHERTNQGPALLLAAAGGILMIVGALLLSRSPVLEATAAPGRPHRPHRSGDRQPRPA